MHGNGNGHKPAIPFMPKSEIPIVGQPFAVKGGFPTAMLHCNCAAHEPVLLIGGAPGLCSGCRQGYVIASFTFNGQTQQIQIQIALVRPPASLLTGDEKEQVPS